MTVNHPSRIAPGEQAAAIFAASQAVEALVFLAQSDAITAAERKQAVQGFNAMLKARDRLEMNGAAGVS
ncbi:hypothetical protein [Thalassococcus sp. S3]|uniref:hypothetical protein n=1 Tax=Thalassococcus sp. S3 TaxID=2017482 RepID=UPI00102AA468|nr:hypothetical protein [Thalassococcus sp. S3]